MSVRDPDLGRYWRRMLAATALMVLGSSAEALAFKELEVQTRYCAGLSINVRLTDGSEADCIKDDLAIEVDFSDHWAQAIGQSLHYASIVGTRPGIILVCNEDASARTCERHLDRLLGTLVYWRVGMLIWYCDAKRDATLADCRYVDLYEDGAMR